MTAQEATTIAKKCLNSQEWDREYQIASALLDAFYDGTTNGINKPSENLQRAKTGGGTNG